MHFHKFEKIWLVFGILSLVIFLSIVGVTAFSHGHTPAGGMDIIDPEKVHETAPFNKPGVHKIDEDTYEVVIIGMAFGYNPAQIKVPAGKEIIFTVTSTDVVHSFTIDDTKVNMMAVPGRITHKSYTFNNPGKYLVLCNEYCGAGHHLMQTEIEVYEP
ncbi:cytochrome c oxidase subunit II [Lederbergia lenta]|uniref:Cytochrome aa3 subunit 2 n=1 Tax=Lederbergia lenta TaxID=1467 RepID=A0A2X4WKN9_LEDLE|nr:cytochrome c oxidase subunit II [Lederbergia lenta]MCM3112913.1 cytochrome c oxidase subunit II [Lederbergia lenta]MEC2326120.1 cytochrome c oxidase subunit II [Lederbergia lenta]SQI63493.1 cytochrome c oxidase subunit II [Lederbergia lenta]